LKQLKSLIIGSILTIALVGTIQSANADICDIGTKDMYTRIYCNMDLNVGGENKEDDEILIEIVATQFGMNKETIKGILANDICESAKQLSKKEQTKLPAIVINACLNKDINNSDLLTALQNFTDIRNAYEKEKAIQFNQKMMKFKFEASEQYWDGNLLNAPFDLMVDLNLIEIVLFGSKAQWMNDVYKFPTNEDENATGETPLELSSEDEGGGGNENPEEIAEGEYTTEDLDGDGIPDNCVSSDHPDANHNISCGNGTIDILLGEQCDDGNKISGDGCSQYCQTELGGSNEQCIDPDAVNFKTTNDASEQNYNNGEENNACPPGTLPRKSSNSNDLTENDLQEVIQALEYPGPFIGGTLKQFPASNRPACGPGETELTAESPGMEFLAGDGSVCMPTQFCADPNLVRDFLFGRGWINDESVAKMALAIESTFCVNITKANRPLSPYSLTEGCIDCHISAMVDSLEEALATNVTPLVNTTSAFAISSAFGPNFSFNLSTAIKSTIKYQESDTAETAIPEFDRTTDENERKNNPPETSRPKPGESALDTIQRQKEQADLTLKLILEDTRMLKLSSATISDQELGGRVRTMLIQMKKSFSNIQNKWDGMVNSTGFDEKIQCKL